MNEIKNQIDEKGYWSTLKISNPGLQRLLWKYRIAFLLRFVLVTAIIILILAWVIRIEIPPWLVVLAFLVSIVSFTINAIWSRKYEMD